MTTAIQCLFFFYFPSFLLHVVDLNMIMFCCQINSMGCASLTFRTSVFFTTRFENDLQDVFLITANVTEEGTGELLADLYQ